VSEAKPFASLSSGLLARKGAARPAMRPQGFTQQSAGLDDLGWNDMGHDPAELAEDGQVVEHPRSHHPTGLSPVTSPVHSQQAELADRFADDDEEYDEEYDETAEPYEPEGGSAGFKGFDFADEEEEEAEPEFRVQFKTGKKPLDLGPGPVEAEEPAYVDVAAPAAEEDMLELGAGSVDAPVFEPEPVLAPAPVARMPHPAVAAVVPEAAPLRTPKGRAVAGAKGKAAFTLRLDPERHLKLRLACAVRGRSAQQLVTDALDQLLGHMPELEQMADQARRG
jgi:hypothetical protein